MELFRSFFALVILSVVFCPKGVFAQAHSKSQTSDPIFTSGAVFLPKSSISSGKQNWSLVTIDMNGDGASDLVSASKADGMVHVHLNQGDGSFSSKRSFETAPANRKIATGDFNQDGAPDIATVTSKGKLVIMQNDGKAGLEKIQVLHVGILCHDLIIGKINQDPFVDIAVVATNDNQIVLFSGNAKGKFNLISRISTGPEPRSIVLGDIDKDGHEDLVVGCDNGRLYIHQGKSGFDFQKKIGIRSGPANWAIGLADFNNDQWLDIVTASYFDKYACIHLSKGGGEFELEHRVISGDHNFDLSIGDFDLDGDLDFATCSTVDESFGFHLNDGKGKFSDRHTIQSGDWNAGICTADFDQDGDLDIATASINDFKLNVHKNISNDHQPKKEEKPCVVGTIYNGKSQVAIPKTPISLLNERGKSIETIMSDEFGRFSFCPEVMQDYSLLVRAYALPTKEVSFFMPDSNITKDIYLFPLSSAFVYGQVREEENNRILPGASIQILDQQGTVVWDSISNDQGKYRKELPFGKGYQILVSHPSYSREQHFFNLDDSHHPKGLRRDFLLKKDPNLSSTCLDGMIVSAKSSEHISQSLLLVQNEFGQDVKKVKIPSDGSFQFRLPYGTYNFYARAKGYFYFSDTLIFEKQEGGDCFQYKIELVPLEVGAQLVLKNIYYDVDRSNIRDDSKEELDRLVDVLKENPRLKVELSSHTDSDASDAYNMDLSFRRAASVVKYLRTQGILKERLVAKGYGESIPIAPNDSPENKQLNRRTEFKVLEN